MSKVLMNRVFAKDTFKVTAATITTSWLPGQFFTLNSSGEASLANKDNALFMGVDDPTLPNQSTLGLSAPPTGSVLTGIYGSGKVYIDHSYEVTNSLSSRAYNTDCESGTVGANLWVDANGKLTLTGSVVSGGIGQTASYTGSVIAKLIQIPAASNNYTIGVLLRI